MHAQAWPTCARACERTCAACARCHGHLDFERGLVDGVQVSLHHFGRKVGAVEREFDVWIGTAAAVHRRQRVRALDEDLQRAERAGRCMHRLDEDPDARTQACTQASAKVKACPARKRRAREVRASSWC
eukprot:6174669-Pleurochrysis_carterae.AAC.1